MAVTTQAPNAAAALAECWRTPVPWSQIPDEVTVPRPAEAVAGAVRRGLAITLTPRSCEWDEKGNRIWDAGPSFLIPSRAPRAVLEGAVNFLRAHPDVTDFDVVIIGPRRRVSFELDPAEAVETLQHLLTKAGANSDPRPGSPNSDGGCNGAETSAADADDRYAASPADAPHERDASPAANGAAPDDHAGQQEEAGPEQNEKAGSGRGGPSSRGDDDAGSSSASVGLATSVAPFPVGVLPPSLARFVTEGAASMQCPADFFGMNMLGIAGAVAGTHVRIQVSCDWQERPCLYAAIVGDPGSVKSPPLERVLRTVRALDAAAYDEWQADMQQWRRVVKALERARRQYERVDLPAYRKALAEWEAPPADERGPQPQAPTPPPNDDPPRPILHRILVDDVTVEALATLLAENPEGLLYAADELSAWTRSLGQYKQGRGRDREVWMQIWNGAAMTIDRKGSHEAGPQRIAEPFVGVVGNLVPDNLDVLLAQGSRSDGFLHRVLVACPNTVLPGAWTGATISRDAAVAWHEAVKKLATMRRLPLPIKLPLTPAATAVWRDFFAAHNAEIAGGTLPYNLIGPWAKLKGYCLRLALIVHLLRWACGEASLDEVDEVSLRAAVTLVGYFKHHTRRVYARLPATPDDRRAERVLAWIRYRGGTVTARDVVRSQVGGIKTAEDAKAVFEELQARELGIVRERDRGRVEFVLRR